MVDVIDGNAAQVRAVAEALAQQMIALYGSPPKSASDIPAPLKWGAGIFAGLVTVGSAGLLFWMVSTISATQLTVVRIDERQALNAEQWEAKFTGLEQRMDRLEQQQRSRALDR